LSSRNACSHRGASLVKSHVLAVDAGATVTHWALALMSEVRTFRDRPLSSTELNNNFNSALGDVILQINS